MEKCCMNPELHPFSGCPLCHKPSAEPHFPFCSKVCEYRDLGVWLRGEYGIPGDPLSEELVVPSSEELLENEDEAS